MQIAELHSIWHENICDKIFSKSVTLLWKLLKIYMTLGGNDHGRKEGILRQDSQ